MRHDRRSALLVQWLYTVLHRAAGTSPSPPPPIHAHSFAQLATLFCLSQASSHWRRSIASRFPLSETLLHSAVNSCISAVSSPTLGLDLPTWPSGLLYSIAPWCPIVPRFIAGERQLGRIIGSRPPTSIACTTSYLFLNNPPSPHTLFFLFSTFN